MLLVMDQAGTHKIHIVIVEVFFELAEPVLKDFGTFNLKHFDKEAYGFGFVPYELPSVGAVKNYFPWVIYHNKKVLRRGVRGAHPCLV